MLDKRPVKRADALAAPNTQRVRGFLFSNSDLKKIADEYRLEMELMMGFGLLKGPGDQVILPALSKALSDRFTEESPNTAK